MNKLHQVSLMQGALTDYQDGLMSLDTLVGKIDALSWITEEELLRHSIFDSLFALEQVNAAMQLTKFESEGMGDFDFETQGRPIVNTAVQDIASKLSAWSSQQSSSGSNSKPEP